MPKLTRPQEPELEGHRAQRRSDRSENVQGERLASAALGGQHVWTPGLSGPWWAQQCRRKWQLMPQELRRSQQALRWPAGEQQEGLQLQGWELEQLPVLP